MPHFVTGAGGDAEGPDVRLGQFLGQEHAQEDDHTGALQFCRWRGLQVGELDLRTSGTGSGQFSLIITGIDHTHLSLYCWWNLAYHSPYQDQVSQ